MSSTLDYIYGPIGKEYCIYFYILSVIGFLSLLLVIIITVYSSLKQKYPMSFYINMIMLAILYGMFYLQNRLLYNMCTGEMVNEGFQEGGRGRSGVSFFKSTSNMAKQTNCPGGKTSFNGSCSRL